MAYEKKIKRYDNRNYDGGISDEQLYRLKKENEEKKETPEKEKPAYFYQWGKHHTSKYGGLDGELNVYEIKDGEFVLIGSAFIQTRAMKGFEGEAMDILYKEGKINKEEYDKDHGYYRRDKHNFKISSVGDMY